MNKLLYIICFFLILSCDKEEQHDLDTDYQYEEEYTSEDIYYLIINNYTPYTCYVECNDGFVVSINPNKTANNLKISTKINSFQISYKNHPYTYSYRESVSGGQGEKYIINIKDPDFPECEKKKVFYVTVKNNDLYTYRILNNDEYPISSVLPNDICTFTLTAGEHSLKFEQVDGYIFFPIVHYEIVSGNSCDNKNVSIPSTGSEEKIYEN